MLAKRRYGSRLGVARWALHSATPIAYCEAEPYCYSPLRSYQSAESPYMTGLHRLALWASVVLLVVAIALFLADRPQLAGPVSVLFFALAAYGVRGNEKLRGISFSLL